MGIDWLERRGSSRRARARTRWYGSGWEGPDERERTGMELIGAERLDRTGTDWMGSATRG